MWTQRSVPSILSSASADHLSSYRISCPCFVLPVVRSGAYLIFVILLTPAPFSADTKNTPNPDLLTPKTHKIADFYTCERANTTFSQNFTLFPVYMCSPEHSDKVDLLHWVLHRVSDQSRSCRVFQHELLLHRCFQRCLLLGCPSCACQDFAGEKHIQLPGIFRCQRKLIKLLSLQLVCGFLSGIPGIPGINSRV